MFSIPPTIFHNTSLLCASGIQAAVGYDGSDDANPDGDADVGWIAFYSSTLSKFVLWNYDTHYPFDCKVSAGADALYGFGAPINDYPAWVGATYCIYRSGALWILRAVAELGYSKPSDASTTKAFWTYSGTEPYAATFVKKGTASADITTNLNSWARWEKAATGGFYGVYTAAGGAIGTKIIGVPQYLDGDGLAYVRSIKQAGGSVDHHYTYAAPGRSVHWDSAAAAWILGTYNSAAGWRQCALEPSATTPRTFAWTTIPAQVDPPTGSDIVLTFDAYVAGDAGSITTYIGEAAIWRT